MKIGLIILTAFILSPGSFGLQPLDGLLEDALLFETSSTRLVEYLETDRAMASSAFRSNNLISGANLNINDSSSRVCSILPLIENKSALAVSADHRNSHFSAVQSPAALEIGGLSNLVNLFYAVRLNERLALGLGVNQAAGEDDNKRALGTSYSVRFSPSHRLAVEYNAANSHLGNLARIDYGQAWLSAPMEGAQNRAELTVTCGFNDKLGLRGLLGQGVNAQSLNARVSDDRYTYAKIDRQTVYGSLGLQAARDQLALNFDLLVSASDLSSSGGLFGFAAPDLVLDGESLDKTADLAARVTAVGARVEADKSVSERLKFKTSLSYLKLLFAGDAKIWNSWFFGLVKKLDTEAVIPLDGSDVLTAGLGVKYALNNNCELNYSFKQLIPIAVTRRETAGHDSDLSAGSAVSGGNTQTFAAAWYF